MFNLSIVNYTWPKRWLPNLYDFKVNLSHEGDHYEGRGSDFDEETALVKAIMEAFERILIKENDLENSNGIALHFDRPSAKINAQAELIERDSFLCHYLTNTKPEIINEIPFELKTCFKKIEGERIQTQTLKLSPTNEHHVVMTISTGINSKNPFGLCLGLAADLNLNKAVWKSSIECIRHITAFLETDYNDHSIYSLRDFLRIQKPDVLDHIKYANNPTIGYEIFKQLTGKDVATLSENRTNIAFIDLKMPKFFDKFNLVGVRAQSQDLQNLFFGITTRQNINLQRLKQFSGEELQFEQLNKLPHPLG